MEGGRPDGFRARIVRTVDGHEDAPAAASGIGDVLSVVHDWLREFLDQEE